MARSSRRPGIGPAGFTLLELLLVLGIAMTMSGVALPGVTQAVARYRTAGAVRAVRATLQRARAAAVARGASVAVRFITGPSGVRFATYTDGNRNGVSTADIANGVDPEVEAAQSLARFGGPSFGIWPGVVAPDGGALAADDPIRVGAANMVSFSPAGGCTSGTVYVRGPGGLQYAVRVFGDTGKTQVLRYVGGDRTWVAE